MGLSEMFTGNAARAGEDKVNEMRKAGSQINAYRDTARSARLDALSKTLAAYSGPQSVLARMYGTQAAGLPASTQGFAPAAGSGGSATPPRLPAANGPLESLGAPTDDQTAMDEYNRMVAKDPDWAVDHVNPATGTYTRGWDPGNTRSQALYGKLGTSNFFGMNSTLPTGKPHAPEGQKASFGSDYAGGKDVDYNTLYR